MIKKLDKHEEDIIMNFLETLPKKGEMLERVLKNFLNYLAMSNQFYDKN